MQSLVVEVLYDVVYMLTLLLSAALFGRFTIRREHQEPKGLEIPSLNVISGLGCLQQTIDQSDDKHPSGYRAPAWVEGSVGSEKRTISQSLNDQRQVLNQRERALSLREKAADVALKSLNAREKAPASRTEQQLNSRQYELSQIAKQLQRVLGNPRPPTTGSIPPPPTPGSGRGAGR